MSREVDEFRNSSIKSTPEEDDFLSYLTFLSSLEGDEDGRFQVESLAHPSLPPPPTISKRSGQGVYLPLKPDFPAHAQPSHPPSLPPFSRPRSPASSLPRALRPLPAALLPGLEMPPIDPFYPVAIVDDDLLIPDEKYNPFYPVVVAVDDDLLLMPDEEYCTIYPPPSLPPPPLPPGVLFPPSGQPALPMPMHLRVFPSTASPVTPQQPLFPVPLRPDPLFSATLDNGRHTFLSPCGPDPVLARGLVGGSPERMIYGAVVRAECRTRFHIRYRIPRRINLQKLTPPEMRLFVAMTRDSQGGLVPNPTSPPEDVSMVDLVSLEKYLLTDEDMEHSPHQQGNVTELYYRFRPRFFIRRRDDDGSIVGPFRKMDRRHVYLIEFRVMFTEGFGIMERVVELNCFIPVMQKIPKVKFHRVNELKLATKSRVMPRFDWDRLKAQGEIPRPSNDGGDEYETRAAATSLSRQSRRRRMRRRRRRRREQQSSPRDRLSPRRSSLFGSQSQSAENVVAIHHVQSLPVYDEDREELELFFAREETIGRSSFFGGISCDEIRVMGILRMDSLSKLYKIEWRNETVCLKYFRCRSNLDDESLAEFEAEVNRYASVVESHPNFLSYRVCTLRMNRICMIIDYSPFGDLHQFISENKDLPLSERLWLLLDICSAMQHFHSNRGELKPDALTMKGVEIDAAGHAIIADFGIEHVIESVSSTRLKANTLFSAPEISLAEVTDESAQSNSFSFSILIYMILTDREPYDRYSKNIAVTVALDPNLRPNVSDLQDQIGITGPALSVLRDCLVEGWLHEASDRTSFVEFEQCLNRCLDSLPEDRIQIEYLPETEPTVEEQRSFFHITPTIAPSGPLARTRMSRDPFVHEPKPPVVILLRSPYQTTSEAEDCCLEVRTVEALVQLASEWAGCEGGQIAELIRVGESGEEVIADDRMVEGLKNDDVVVVRCREGEEVVVSGPNSVSLQEGED